MATRILAAVIVLAAGCVAPLPGTHGTMHPSVDGTSSGAGAAVGAIYAHAEDGDEDSDDSSDIFAIPYGEGWARFGAGPGQVELRVGAPFATGAYRWNVAGGPDSGFGFSLIPGLGLAYVNTAQTRDAPMGGTEEEEQGAIVFAPELGFLFAFAQGQFYLAPRIGWLHFATFDDDLPDDVDTTSDYLQYGGAIGWNFGGAAPFWYSLELSLLVVDDMDDDDPTTGENDDGTTWYFLPTFGFHTG